MAGVTPLNITLIFSRVCGAKDPSLANLPSQLLEKQSKSKNTDTNDYGKPFLTCIISLYKTKLFSLSQSTMLTPLSIQRTLSQSLISHIDLSRMQEPF